MHATTQSAFQRLLSATVREDVTDRITSGLKELPFGACDSHLGHEVVPADGDRIDSFGLGCILTRTAGPMHCNSGLVLDTGSSRVISASKSSSFHTSANVCRAARRRPPRAVIENEVASRSRNTTHDIVKQAEEELSGQSPA